MASVVRALKRLVGSSKKMAGTDLHGNEYYEVSAQGVLKREWENCGKSCQDIEAVKGNNSNNNIMWRHCTCIWWRIPCSYPVLYLAIDCGFHYCLYWQSLTLYWICWQEEEDRRDTWNQWECSRQNSTHQMLYQSSGKVSLLCNWIYFWEQTGHSKHLEIAIITASQHKTRQLS